MIGVHVPALNVHWADFGFGRSPATPEFLAMGIPMRAS